MVRLHYSIGHPVNSVHLFFIVVTRPFIGLTSLCQWFPQDPGAGSGVQCAETGWFVSGDPWDRHPGPGRVPGHRRQQAAVAGQDSTTRGRQWGVIHSKSDLLYCQKKTMNVQHFTWWETIKSYQEWVLQIWIYRNRVSVETLIVCKWQSQNVITVWLTSEALWQIKSSCYSFENIALVSHFS